MYTGLSYSVCYNCFEYIVIIIDFIHLLHSLYIFLVNSIKIVNSIKFETDSINLFSYYNVLYAEHTCDTAQVK